LIRLPPGGKPNRFLLRLPNFVHSQRGSHSNFNSVGFEVSVLRLTCVGSERHRLVEDIFNFVERNGEEMRLFVAMMRLAWRDWALSLSRVA
jgi:hypothetical protein